MTCADLCCEGFRTVGRIRELQTSRDRSHIPVCCGVYAVIWPTGVPAEFLKENAGRPAATVDPSIIEQAWVSDSDILYIGSTIRALRKRIAELIRHGQGRTEKHKGGEWIWQISGISRALLIAFETSDPGGLEAQVLETFRGQHGGRLPFANRRL